MDIPYELLLSAVLTAGGTATLTYQVPQGQQLEIDEFVFVSTGIFSLVGIRSAGGINFTNATPSNGIPSTMLANGVNQFNVIKDFKPNLIVAGGDTINFDLIDTSAAPNTIRLLLNCKKTQQGN